MFVFCRNISDDSKKKKKTCYCVRGDKIKNILMSLAAAPDLPCLDID